MSVTPNSQRLKALKNRIRSVYRKAERAFVTRFRSYGDDESLNALRVLGIQPGDSVLLHSGFEARFGYRGTIEQLTDVFVEAVGEQGNLLMVSMPYQTATLDYLGKGKVFDVRRTPSAMGLVSEFFRRRRDVLRSLHPTHPVLARGPRSAWFVDRHEDSIYPCGPETPFGKLLEAGGKSVFFNVPFASLTFFHYLEHLVSKHVGFPLYHGVPFDVQVIDRDGASRTVRTMVFGREAIRRRRPEVLESWLSRHGVIKKVRIGASVILLVDLREVVEAVDDMIRQGVFFYDRSAPAGDAHDAG